MVGSSSARRTGSHAGRAYAWAKRPLFSPPLHQVRGIPTLGKRYRLWNRREHRSSTWRHRNETQRIQHHPVGTGDWNRHRVCNAKYADHVQPHRSRSGTHRRMGHDSRPSRRHHPERLAPRRPPQRTRYSAAWPAAPLAVARTRVPQVPSRVRRRAVQQATRWRVVRDRAWRSPSSWKDGQRGPTSRGCFGPVMSHRYDPAHRWARSARSQARAARRADHRSQRRPTQSGNVTAIARGRSGFSSLAPRLRRPRWSDYPPTLSGFRTAPFKFDCSRSLLELVHR